MPRALEKMLEMNAKRRDMKKLREKEDSIFWSRSFVLLKYGSI